MDAGHHRLAGIGAKFGHDRHERRPERLKCLLRLPDVEDLDLPVRLEGYVVRASFRRARTGVRDDSSSFSSALEHMRPMMVAGGFDEALVLARRRAEQLSSPYAVSVVMTPMGRIRLVLGGVLVLAATGLTNTAAVGRVPSARPLHPHFRLIAGTDRNSQVATDGRYVPVWSLYGTGSRRVAVIDELTGRRFGFTPPSGCGLDWWARAGGSDAAFPVA